MRRTICVFLLTLILAIGLTAAAGSDKLSFAQYHKPGEVTALLKGYAAKFGSLAKVLPLGQSSGGQEMALLRIAAGGKTDPDKRPAVFVAANIEGAHLIGTESALLLVDKLLNGYGKDKAISALLDRRTVYVAPLLNPDAAAQFFAAVRWERFANARPVDDDVDGQVDEDGPDDLNKDGLITQMRVKDPEGTYVPDPREPRLMRLADPKKGEKGIYKLYSEGLDNDGDGQYNEDGPGGVELNRNFPHDWEHAVRAAGLYPVSEKETIALVRFLVDHAPIAMILNFSTENTILNQQQTGQARVASDKVKVPKMIASFLGLEPDSEHTIKEIVEILKGMNVGGGIEITEDLVAQFFGIGPAMAIDQQDQPIFEAVQKEFKDALKEAKLEYPEKRARGVGKGAFAAYAYYQYGVPAFSLDVWAVPEPKKEQPKDALTPEKLKTMSNEEFLALGEEKIGAFLKESGAPPNFNAAMLINMVKSGQVTPARMAEMMERMPKRPGAEGEDHPDLYLLQYSDKVLGGKGFVNWTPFQHPTLGAVEIGGFVPYLKIDPPPSEIEKVIGLPADFYIKLMAKLPELAVKESRVEALDPDMYRVTLYLTNSGWLPTATAQGRRALTSWPIRVRLNLGAGQSVFSGRPIEIIPSLNGGETRKLEWTVKGAKGSKLSVAIWSPKLGTLDTVLELK